MIKERYKQAYMDVAKRYAELSHCERRKVGAILVREDNSVSFGINGTPEGEDNHCEEWVETGEVGTKVLITKSNVLHAEDNLFRKLNYDTSKTEGGTIFLSLSPCKKCAELIKKQKIHSVYYHEIYRDTEGLAILRQAGIYTKQL